MIPNCFVAKIKWGEVGGQKLKQLRKDKQITQVGLCKAIGVSRQTLCEWEIGTKYQELSFDRLELICKALSIDIDYFVLEYLQKKS